MKKKIEVRIYKMSDPRLSITAGEKHTFMVRDAAEFADFNVLPAEMLVFRNDITDFEDLPTDLELEAVKKSFTDAKDVLANDVKEKVRKMMTRAKNLYGESNAKYDEFGTKDMSNMDDPNLLICGRRVARTAAKYQAELAAKGLTLAMITDLKNTCNLFETAQLDQSEAIADRDKATNDRVVMGNALYTKMVEYCETGKSIWATSDESLYNDYVIYDTPDAPPPAPPVV